MDRIRYINIMKNIWVFFFLLLFTFKYSYCQVNLQSGSATFSLPMFDWQDNKSRLNFNMSLNYNSGNGLKVSDVASNVGQGWNLVAGGNITRIQVGEPDDQIPKDGGPDDISKYPAGYLYASNSPGKGCPNALTLYPICETENHLYKPFNSTSEDRQLDFFAFQFNGRGGMFVLDKQSGTGVCIDDSRLKISFETGDMSSMNCRTSIKFFTIQDENGLKYKFGNYYGFTKVLKTKYCDANFISEQDQPTFEDNGIYHQTSFDYGVYRPYITSSWYLFEIEDPFTNRTINFTYTTEEIQNSEGNDISINNNIDYTNNKSKTYAIIHHKISKDKTCVINQIDFHDGHKINFNYSGEDRFDLNGDHPLLSVDVLYNNRFISKFVFNTNYVMLSRYGKPSNDFEKKCARLYFAFHPEIWTGFKKRGLSLYI